MIDTVIVEVPNPRHPYGMRGVGETPVVPPLAAIANAVAAAMGVRFTDLPMSPPKVLAALEVGHGWRGWPGLEKAHSTDDGSGVSGQHPVVVPLPDGRRQYRGNGGIGDAALSSYQSLAFVHTQMFRIQALLNACARCLDVASAPAPDLVGARSSGHWSTMAASQRQAGRLAPNANRLLQNALGLDLTAFRGGDRIIRHLLPTTEEHASPVERGAVAPLAQGRGGQMLARAAVEAEGKSITGQDSGGPQTSLGQVFVEKQMFRVCLMIIALCHLMLLPQAAAQSPTTQPKELADPLLRGQSKADANAGTVTIMTQRVLDGPIMQAALDLSTLLDDGERFEKMRVLPIVARGKMQNLWDIIYLNGVDMGFLQADTLEVLKSDPQIEHIKSRVRYITVMFPEEITLVARSDIKSLQDLVGKKISINAKGTASNVTAPIIFRRLGIEAQLVSEESSVAIARLRSGDLAAHVFLLAKPARPILQLKGEGLHILPLPYSERFIDYYLPSKLTHQDYPNLVAPDEQVETIAVGQVLVAINVPENSLRYRKIARFVDAFFTRIDDLRKPGFLPQWKDVNIAAEVRGWTRFKAAQDWLDRRAKQEAMVKKDLRETFNSYLKKSGPTAAADKEKLFEEFLKWQREGKR
jgi:uncharacterized protein